MIKKYILEFTSNGAKVKIEFLTEEARADFIDRKSIINYILSEFEDVDANLEP